MRVGKLPPHLLERLLESIEIGDPRVIVGPRLGEDAAVLDMGDRLLVATTDPITFATDLIGEYAVHVNANDIAVMGAKPRWFLATILLPEAAEEPLVERIWDQILQACRSLGVTLIGGHTEVTHRLPRPIVAGCMLGEVDRERLVTTAGARVGDDILFTKGIAVEGTALLAREAEARLLAAGVSRRVVRRAREFLFDPGISVVQEALVASGCARVHCMHDPTEGGLAAGLWEIARAAGVGLRVDEGQIPLLPETAVICKKLGLDPLGLLASGSLIITAAPQDTPRMLSALKERGVEARIIGKVTVVEEGVRIHRASGEEALPLFSRDELARFLEEASPHDLL